MAGLHDMAPMVANAMGDERGRGAHAGGRGRSLAAGMATANHHDVDALGHGRVLVKPAHSVKAFAYPRG